MVGVIVTTAGMTTIGVVITAPALR